MKRIDIICIIIMLYIAVEQGITIFENLKHDLKYDGDLNRAHNFAIAFSMIFISNNVLRELF